MARPPTDLRTRLDRQTKKTSSCWLFTGAETKDGYGKFQVPACFSPTGKPRTVRAHQVAWCLSRGQWPMQAVLHTCDVRLCIRPDHLFEGTAFDNAQDAKRKGRTATAANGQWHAGVRNPENAHFAKLTWPKVRRIRRLLREGKRTPVELAVEYDVTPGLIYQIKRGRIWKSD